MMIAHVVYLDPNMMMGILLYGFAGALLGGIDNPIGAVIGPLVCNRKFTLPSAGEAKLT